MNWLVRRIVDGYRALSKKMYARRYGTMVRQMGHEEIAPLQEDESKRGFIVIQIDGLAYDHLVQAIARGAAPYIKRLIGAGRLRLAPWRCGFPSTTPVVQAGIMFGDNWDVPGFRWYDKAQRRALVCKRPNTVQALQRRVSVGRRGILSGGSSYYNMFDGDAEWSVFTLSAMRAPRFFEGVRGLGLTLLFLLSPLRVLRVIRRAVWNYLLDMGRRLLAIFRPSVYRPLDLLSPMAHIFTRVLFQEIITFGVQMDIYRGASAIYLNNATYDEAAHHIGPTHPAVFKTIKNIDQQVAQIDKMLKRYRQRTYDLYILSDHGMSPSVPFKERFGLSLGDYIVQQIGEPLILDERWSAPGHALTQARYLLEELRGLEEQLSPRNANVVRATREYLSRRMPWVHDPDQEPWDLTQHSDIAVRVSGSLAHVYFNVSDQRLNLSELALLYPTLLTRLIEHPGIGLVVGREGEETVMMSRGGTLTVGRNPDESPAQSTTCSASHLPSELPARQVGQRWESGAGRAVSGKRRWGNPYESSPHRLYGRNPLAGLHDPHDQAARIDYVASFPHAGDLILLGAWESEVVVTFEDQIGTHGGVGGPQEKPFILYPADMDWPSDTIKSPCDLYPIFVRYLDAAAVTPQPTSHIPQPGLEALQESQ